MNNHEQEIDLKDLMFFVLYRWRGIIVAAVIFAIVLGGYKMYSSTSVKQDVVEAQKNQELYEEELELYDSTKLLYETNREYIKEKLNLQNEYILNSVLMQLSPYNIPVAIADIFVKTENDTTNEQGFQIIKDDSDSIVKAYETIILMADGIDSVSDDSIENKYLRELITTQVDYDGNMIHLQVAYKDEDGAKEIMDALIANINNKFEDVQKELGAHEVVIMNENTGIIADKELTLAQEECFRSIEALKTLQKDNEGMATELEKPSSPLSMSTGMKLKSSVKYGILGGVLGAFLSVFYVCVLFFVNGRIYSEKELKNKFELKILGVFPQMTKKRVFIGIDKWLNGLEGKKDKKPAEVFDLICMNIENSAAPNQEVVLLGHGDEQKMREIQEELKSRMPRIQLRIGQDKDNSVELFKLISNADQIVMVEERGKSKYEDIKEQVEVIGSLKKNILGCIVL